MASTSNVYYLDDDIPERRVRHLCPACRDKTEQIETLTNLLDFDIKTFERKVIANHKSAWNA